MMYGKTLWIAFINKTTYYYCMIIKKLSSLNFSFLGSCYQIKVRKSSDLRFMTLYKLVVQKTFKTIAYHL